MGSFVIRPLEPSATPKVSASVTETVAPAAAVKSGSFVTMGSLAPEKPGAAVTASTGSWVAATTAGELWVKM